MPSQFHSLQGEVVALRCAVAALLGALPPEARQCVWPTFERMLELMRDQLPPAAKESLDRTATSIAAVAP